MERQGLFQHMQSPKNLGGYFLHFSSSSTSMSAIKTVSSVSQFILSITLLAQVGIIKKKLVCLVLLILMGNLNLERFHCLIIDD